MTASIFVPCPRCRGTAILKELADQGRLCAFCEREQQGKQSNYRDGRAAPSYTTFDRSPRPNA